MTRRRGERGDSWQGFADLAMGLMAMMTLILLILLAKQRETGIELEAAQKRSEQELVQVRAERTQLDSLRRSLEEERTAFAVELKDLFDATFALVESQDKAENWVSSLFRETGCSLVLGPTGQLEIAENADDAGRSAGLYESGATRLSAAGQNALTSCRNAFLRLAYCLAPTPEHAIQEGEAERRRAHCAGAEPPDDATLDMLSSGIEALALEGSTDRIPYGSTPSIQGTGGRMLLSQTGENFASNAYLGAERARQAMGYLVGLMRDYDADPYDAHEVLLSRLSVESTSFGRYQVGPPQWRVGDCAESDNCDAARNLSLRLRWRKKALRSPLETIRTRVCALIAQSDSALAIGLRSAKFEPSELATRLRCDSLKSPGAP